MFWLVWMDGLGLWTLVWLDFRAVLSRKLSQRAMRLWVQQRESVLRKIPSMRTRGQDRSSLRS